MAFATLPYPSMDFVPLDVLTADELDQIVANINAVNNGTAGASQIASNAITEAKIADGAISTNKVAGNAITEAKMGLVGTPLTFSCASGGSTVGSLSGTLIKLGANLAVLVFAGSTGWNDSGTGARNIVVNLSPANFTSIKGASVNSWYSGDVSAYQTYCGVSTASIDNYVQKSAGASEARFMSGVIFGTVS